MKQEDIEHSINQIQNGNEVLREQLIHYYQPYILSVVGKVSKKYITWNDDEASIGLIAFNRAIDTYNPEKGRAFLNYVYLIIQRELIDFFRKENYYQNVNQKNVELLTINVNKASVEHFMEEQRFSTIAEEIIDLNEQLSRFYIRFEELESYSPKQKRTRKKVLEIAENFIQNETHVVLLFRRKQFPIKDFVALTNYRVKTIEKYRKYIIAIIIILLHPEWKYLQSYIKAKVKGGEKM
ncbi:RNA polymerase heat shock sigma factor SigI [Gracilibacillus boraciitolerans JCM 21714]|uniref:RNA polymerase sigma factor SigI n=1 Tax=Gracilibacillus boraciitolerans JCM 21714 TaxID=1298598 RepID=W4VN14_9BACI|nr:RNA polymerase sigma-I factor [Gracilibacillus boraciitolerans]GAE94577.1 RNA polymerase heat shock sigma factor SigI [Gracilibacillus boraciitolerans JCM 21714]